MSLIKLSFARIVEL